MRQLTQFAFALYLKHTHHFNYTNFQRQKIVRKFLGPHKQIRLHPHATLIFSVKEAHVVGLVTNPYEVDRDHLNFFIGRGGGQPKTRKSAQYGYFHHPRRRNSASCPPGTAQSSPSLGKLDPSSNAGALVRIPCEFSRGSGSPTPWSS